jgi:hypothetical protein
LFQQPLSQVKQVFKVNFDRVLGIASEKCHQLRPSYGDGFLGAAIQIGTRQQTPTPPAQGDARGSSTPSTSEDAGDSHHV